MGTQVLLATHNRGKVEELRRILEAADLAGVELLCADDVDLPDVEETGTTFCDNALLKARAAVAVSGLACLADDSGLVVDALGGDPGVHSARYAGRHGDDGANLQRLLQELGDTPEREARFVCVAAFVTPQGVEQTVTGVLEGDIATEARGANGFGYDPVFIPRGYGVTTAQLAAADKDAISHRGQAFRAIIPAVAAYAAGAS